VDLVAVVAVSEVDSAAVVEVLAGVVLPGAGSFFLLNHSF
jgi:hypothetical protein